MKEGDIFKFFIPSNTLRIEDEMKKIIGPNLIVEIELLEIL